MIIIIHTYLFKIATISPRNQRVKNILRQRFPYFTQLAAHIFTHIDL